jgi:glycosyltransferase involved in cell wall biosynthesis
VEAAPWKLSSCCGALAAQGLKERLLAAWPAAVVQQRFMGPAELAALYRATRLNVHPCSYDAFGMTLVEAASQVGRQCAPNGAVPFHSWLCCVPNPPQSRGCTPHAAHVCIACHVDWLLRP